MSSQYSQLGTQISISAGTGRVKVDGTSPMQFYWFTFEVLALITGWDAIFSKCNVIVTVNKNTVKDMLCSHIVIRDAKYN